MSEFKHGDKIVAKKCKYVFTYLSPCPNNPDHCFAVGKGASHATKILVSNYEHYKEPLTITKWAKVYNDDEGVTCLCETLYDEKDSTKHYYEAIDWIEVTYTYILVGGNNVRV